MTIGLPHGYTPQRVDNPKKDIEKQSQDIKKAEDAIAGLQRTKLDADRLTGLRLLFLEHGRIPSPGQLNPVRCNPNGCFLIFVTDSFGGPSARVLLRVDAKGNLLPGEFQKAVNAETKAIDLAIAQNTQLLTNAKTQMAFDYTLLPVPGNGGADLHRGSALNQQ